MSFDPTIGRWIEQDPSGYDDSSNLYIAFDDRPAVDVDLLGLKAQIVETDDLTSAEIAKLHAQATTGTLPSKGSIDVTVTCGKKQDGSWGVVQVDDTAVIRVRVADAQAIEDHYKNVAPPITAAEVQRIQHQIFGRYEQTSNAGKEAHAWDGNGAVATLDIKAATGKTEGDLEAQVKKLIDDEWLKPFAGDVAQILTADKHALGQQGQVSADDVLKQLNSVIAIRIGAVGSPATQPAATPTK